MKKKQQIHNPPPVDGMIHGHFAAEVDVLLADLNEVLLQNARRYAPDNEQIQLTTYYWGVNAVIAKLAIMAGDSQQGDTLHKCISEDHEDDVDK